MAALELRAGDGARAVDLLNAARLYEPGPYSLVAIYLRGLAYLKTKSGREGAAEFQKILDHHGVWPWSILYPLSELGLGRAVALVDAAAGGTGAAGVARIDGDERKPCVGALVGEEAAQLVERPGRDDLWLVQGRSHRPAHGRDDHPPAIPGRPPAGPDALSRDRRRAAR